MHGSSFLRVQWFVENIVQNNNNNNNTLRNVLEVGGDSSSIYKKLFSDNSKYNYKSLDIDSDSDSDIILKTPYDWSCVASNSFDIIICCQVFEHAEFWWITLEEMARVLNKGGFMCIVVPNKYKEHKHPKDCYRFYTDGVVSMANYINFDIVHASTNMKPINTTVSGWCHGIDFTDTFLIAKKPYEGHARIIDRKSYKIPVSNNYDIGWEKINATWRHGKK